MATLAEERPATDLVSVPRAILTRLEVEDFLYREAAMLDRWELDAWFALFTQECAYEVTPPGLPDPESLSRTSSYFVIGDDANRLFHRVSRIKDPSAHVEQPRSKTRHLYSNIIVEAEDGDTLTVGVSFVTFRTKRGTVEYFGKIRFRLVRDDGSFKIREKRIMLDVDALVPQSRISIFL